MSSQSTQDQTNSLPQGEKPAQLKGADDLAIEALSQASSTAKAVSKSSNDSLSEVDQSDEFAQTLHSLESVIESKANKLMDLKQRAQEKNEMVKNVFESDAQFQEAEDVKNEATQAHKQRRSALEDTAQIRSLRDDLRQIKEEMKDLEESLSNHLISYHQLTNSTSFDTSDGDQWEFNIKAKVKSKKR